MPGIPTISNGWDFYAHTTLLMNNMLKQMHRKERGQSIDFNKIDEGIDKLPDQPDENLR